jgi:hypothetical protein
MRAISLSIAIAQRFGLVTLIARGYRALAGIFLLVYVLPLLTVGLARLRYGARAVSPRPANAGTSPATARKSSPQ